MDNVYFIIIFSVCNYFINYNEVFSMNKNKAITQCVLSVLDFVFEVKKS